MYRRPITIYKQISKREALELIYEARYFPKNEHGPEEIVAYEKVDVLYRIKDNIPPSAKLWS